MKFRKKPVVIEAIQWTGNNWDEVKQFAKLDLIGVDEEGWLDWTEQFDKTKIVAVKVASIEGMVFATVGDWIIRGIKNEHYACRPDIFEATYEKVQE